LVSVTFMSAPKTPVGIGRPKSAARRATNSAKRGAASAAGAAADYDGRLPFAVDA
jgi:hypothetical protein